MSNFTKYILVSLPTSISSSNDQEGALSALQSTITDYGMVFPFAVPDFKIGTLDALIQQADSLAKLNSSCEILVAKVGDWLRILLEGDEAKVTQQKTINDKPADQYLRTFAWNKVKYRADKPLTELIDILQKELSSIDNDVKSKSAQHHQVKTNLILLQRKQSGNLSTKSLAPVVDPSVLVQDSEYLETHLVVVPTNGKKEFLRSYETVSPMVVPRSALEITHDDEYTLFAVTTFKKHSTEFLHNCREMKWTPRVYKYVEGDREQEQREFERASKDERKIWGEALRMGRTSWSEVVMIWVHVLALRVFVETVLRYGLPLEFVSAIVKTTPKLAKKAKTSMDSVYSYLGGSAFGWDSKGKASKDDSILSSEIAAAGIGGPGGENSEYTAYVYFEFEIE